MGSKEELQEVTNNIDNVDETMVELDEMSEEEEEEGDEDFGPSRKKTEDDGSPDYQVPGVAKVVLDEDIQTNLGIVVGVDVTGEHPWKMIKKELIVDNMVAQGSRSPFTPLKKQINIYKEPDILIGYLLDETNDVDEFYVCLTTAAKEYCEIVAEEFLQKQAKRLDESVVKNCGEWKSMGTDTEVDDSIVKYSRPLIRVEIRSKFPIKNQTDRFTARNANDVRDGYLELIPVKAVTDNLFKKRIDAQVQVTPSKVTSSAQTIPRFPKNIWTQYSTDPRDAIDEEQDENDDEPPAELTDYEKHKLEIAAKLAEKEKELTELRLKDFIYQKAGSVERVLEFNGEVDLYNLDYPKLVKNIYQVEGLRLNELIVFSDKRTKNKYVSAVTWHPLHTQFVAVSYIDSIPSVVSYSSSIPGEDEVKRAIYGENPVLVWSVFDSLKPKYYLEANSEVSILSLCAFDENLLVGGCLNGQIILWDAKVLGEEEISEVLTDTQETNRLTLYSGMRWMKKIHDRYVVRTTVSSDVRTSHNAMVTDISWVSSHYEFNEFGKLRKLPKNAPRSKQFLSCSQDGTLLIWDLKISEALKAKHELVSKTSEIPKVLIFEKSPYKILKGQFKPIFRVVTGILEKRMFDPLTRMTIQYPLVNKLVHSVGANGKKVVSEQYDTDNQDSEKDDVGPVICLASLYGQYLRLTWSGMVAGGDVNYTPCDYLSQYSFHGGIIVACIKNTFYSDPPIVATVGGNIIAIWQGEKQNKPIAWKRMNYFLKGASWSKKVPSQLYILTENGTIDVWDFLERSDQPVRSQTLTGTFSTGVYAHQLFNKYILSIADSSASLSIYSVPNIFIEAGEHDKELTRKLFEREREVTEGSESWSTEWVRKNPSSLDRYKQTEASPLKVDNKLEKTKATSKDDEEKHYGFQGAEISEKLPASLRLIEAGNQLWKRMQWEGVELAIQIRKALNKAELLFYEKPLRDVEAQKRSKRKKLLDALENRNKIFEECVEILFPEAVPKIPPEPILKSIEEIRATRKNIMQQYESTRKKNKSFVKHNLYKFSFSWSEQISIGKERCTHLDEVAAIFVQLNKKIKHQLEFPTLKVEEEKVETVTIKIAETEESQKEMVLPEKKELAFKKPAPSPPPSPVLTDVDSDSEA